MRDMVDSMFQKMETKGWKKNHGSKVKVLMNTLSIYGSQYFVSRIIFIYQDDVSLNIGVFLAEGPILLENARPKGNTTWGYQRNKRNLRHNMASIESMTSMRHEIPTIETRTSRNTNINQ